jgi:hypothetical protein
VVHRPKGLQVQVATAVRDALTRTGGLVLRQGLPSERTGSFDSARRWTMAGVEIKIVIRERGFGDADVSVSVREWTQVTLKTATHGRQLPNATPYVQWLA